MYAIPALLLSFAFSQAPGQTAGFDTDVTVPANARPFSEAKADGVQIYTCQAQGLSYGWAFKAPEATLSGAGGQPLGTHGAGPLWTAPDGSSITGRVVAQRVAADPLSVPWLLLAATPGAGKPGVLSNVVFVRRSDTRGGIAPVDGCDATHVGNDVRVPYSATYTFYKSETK